MALSARYAQDLGVTPLHEVLQQLEDLRLAEWSDHAPPPPPPPPNQHPNNMSSMCVAAHLGGALPAGQQSYHQVRTSDHILHSRGEKISIDFGFAFFLCPALVLRSMGYGRSFVIADKICQDSRFDTSNCKTKDKFCCLIRDSRKKTQS